MAHYRNIRSFAITLAIAIALTESVRGFTIQRKYYAQADLDTAESVNVEVRHTEHEASKADSEHIGLDTTVIAIKYPKKADINNIHRGTVPPSKSPEVSLNKRKIDSKKMEKIPVTQRTAVLTSTYETTAATSKGKIQSNEPLNITSTKSITTSNTASNESVEEPESTIAPLIAPEIQKENTSNTKNINRGPQESLRDLIKPSEKKQSIHKSKQRNISQINKTANKDDTKKIIEVTTHTVIQSSESVTKTLEATLGTTVGSTPTAVTSGLTSSSNGVHLNTNIDVTTTTSDQLVESSTKPLNLFETSTELTNSYFDNTHTFTTETATIEDITSPIPIRKKYITLDRKQTTTTEIAPTSETPTTFSKDMLGAETAQTRVNLEKVFTNTPVPILEKLRNDFTSEPKIETTFETSATDDIIMLEISTEYPATMQATKAIKFDVVSSKRAGFIHNTEATTKTTEESIGTMSLHENEGSEVELYKGNATGVESQSQLVEDAIQEELLKEKTINDIEENAKRYREDSSNKTKASRSDEFKRTTDYSGEIVTEDALSVKPIGLDKKKGLYSAANYKPMKKIDIQPASKFIRDPDDNSWRNESISSLGIVFKAKNASKSFKEVLRNKTESELGSVTEKENKSGEVPDLKLRLEKIAEVRKSKKKRINKYGDTVYSDYEENSAEIINSTNTSSQSSNADKLTEASSAVPPITIQSLIENDLSVNAIDKQKYDIFKNEQPITSVVTPKAKKPYNSQEYYDTTDEYDADYFKLSKIDLKKFTQEKTTPVTRPPELMYTKPTEDFTESKPINEYLSERKPSEAYFSERKPTVQYFPPTTKMTTKVVMNQYDNDFKNRVNLYTVTDSPKHISPVYTNISPNPAERIKEPLGKVTVKPTYNKEFDQNPYLTNQPSVTSPTYINDGSFNRASYVIKHYRDFINEAVKKDEGERGDDNAYTEIPLHGVTLKETDKVTTKDGIVNHELDYDTEFRKDILNRFVDNFNQNSERFKVDFPILYNSSIVHGHAPENGKLASSSTFLKRLYESGNRGGFLTNTKPPCTEAHCDNMTVELSPAYELQYYVPEQEEKDEFDPRPITMPYRYRS